MPYLRPVLGLDMYPSVPLWVIMISYIIMLIRGRGGGDGFTVWFVCSCVGSWLAARIIQSTIDRRHARRKAGYIDLFGEIFLYHIIDCRGTVYGLPLTKGMAWLVKL